MGISRVGSSNATSDATAAVSGQQANDLLIVYAFRSGNSTPPSTPVGWTSLDTASQGAGGSSVSMRAGWKLASGSSDTSGTWTNATHTIMVAYRAGRHTNPVPNITNAQEANKSYIRYGAVTLANTDGTHWVAAGGMRFTADAGVATAPTDMTNVTSNPATPVCAAHDTNGGYAQNWASTDVTGLAGTVAYCSLVLEIAPMTYQLSMGAGTFTLTGNNAGLLRAYRMVMAAGSFALTGQAAALKKGWKLVAGAGDFVLTGLAVALTVFRRAFYRTTVQAEDRTTKARSESRTTSAKSENRTTRVPADPQGVE